MTDVQGIRDGWSLWLIGLVAAVVSSLANLVLMYATKPVLGVPETFGPLTPAPILFWSVIGAFGAIGAYALVRALSQRPKRVFLIAAIVVLVISFIPDLALSGVSDGPFAGATPEVIAVLMAMHVVSFAVVVAMLYRLARAA